MVLAWRGERSNPEWSRKDAGSHPSGTDHRAASSGGRRREREIEDRLRPAAHSRCSRREMTGPTGPDDRVLDAGPAELNSRSEQGDDNADERAACDRSEQGEDRDQDDERDRGVLLPSRVRIPAPRRLPSRWDGPILRRNEHRSTFGAWAAVCS